MGPSAARRGASTCVPTRVTHYEIGYNDGREHWSLDSSFADTCTVDQRGPSRESYQRG